MCFTKYAIFGMLAFAVLPVFAQERLTGYLEPSFAVGYALSPEIRQNASIRQRTYFFRAEDFVLDTRQLDLALFTEYKWAAGRSASLGVQYRFREPFEPESSNELRITQQFNLSYRPNVLRLGHRLRTEQRIFSARTIHRFRYRFALDGPLQGEQTDVGEFYWVGSLEPLLSAGRGTGPEHDLRLTAWVGFQAGPSLRIQAGPEYRWENYTQQTENVLFFLTSCVLVL